jgi:hypothetical protein
MKFFPLDKDITSAAMLTKNMITVIPSAVVFKIIAPLKEISIQKTLIWKMKKTHTLLKYCKVTKIWRVCILWNQNF